MSASFYDLLKYAATGISSPSMTYYDRMRASTLMGGAVRTLTGQPPLTFKADGSPLISWSMKGNGSQQGTPTPDNPVMPTFCGVRTGNLFDENMESGTIRNDGEPDSSIGRIRSVNFIEIEAGTYTLTASSNRSLEAFVFVYDLDGVFIERIPTVWTSVPYSFTISTNSKIKVVFTFVPASGSVPIKVSDVTSIMLNLGSTALPYEPYGWAEKITCAGQTVPVYLGQVSTVRKIKKLVLNGTEGWQTGTTHIFNLPIDTYLRNTGNIPFCTHYDGIRPVEAVANIGDKETAFLLSSSGNNRFYIRDDTYASVNDFKSYLAAQYAAGTPVTVWYVLATEQTGIVNEPLCKIGDYADELHSTDAAVTIPTVKGSNTLTVDTELQPSEMTITFKG